MMPLVDLISYYNTHLEQIKQDAMNGNSHAKATLSAVSLYQSFPEQVALGVFESVMESYIQEQEVNQS